MIRAIAGTGERYSRYQVILFKKNQQ